MASRTLRSGRQALYNIPVNLVDSPSQPLPPLPAPSGPPDSLIREFRHSDKPFRQELSLLSSLLRHRNSDSTSASDTLQTAVLQLINHHNSPVQNLPAFATWALSAVPLYKEYLSGYRYDPEEALQMAYLLKRPLVRARYLAKLLQTLQGADTENIYLSKAAAGFTQLSGHIKVEMARQRAQLDATRIDFSRVQFADVPAGGLRPCSSSFSPSAVTARGFFNFWFVNEQLNVCWGMKFVELLVVEEANSVPALAVCQVEEIGRTLLFPPLRVPGISLAKQLFPSKRQSFVFDPRKVVKDSVYRPLMTELQDESQLNVTQEEIEQYSFLLEDAQTGSKYYFYCPEFGQVAEWKSRVARLEAQAASGASEMTLDTPNAEHFGLGLLLAPFSGSEEPGEGLARTSSVHSVDTNVRVPVEVHLRRSDRQLDADAATDGFSSFSVDSSDASEASGSTFGLCEEFPELSSAPQVAALEQSLAALQDKVDEAEPNPKKKLPLAKRLTRTFGLSSKNTSKTTVVAQQTNSDSKSVHSLSTVQTCNDMKSVSTVTGSMASRSRLDLPHSSQSCVDAESVGSAGLTSETGSDDSRAARKSEDKGNEGSVSRRARFSVFRPDKSRRATLFGWPQRKLGGNQSSASVGDAGEKEDEGVLRESEESEEVEEKEENADDGQLAVPSEDSQEISPESPAGCGAEASDSFPISQPPTQPPTQPNSKPKKNRLSLFGTISRKKTKKPEIPPSTTKSLCIDNQMFEILNPLQPTNSSVPPSFSYDSIKTAETSILSTSSGVLTHNTTVESDLAKLTEGNEDQKEKQKENQSEDFRIPAKDISGVLRDLEKSLVALNTGDANTTNLNASVDTLASVSHQNPGNSGNSAAPAESHAANPDSSSSFRLLRPPPLSLNTSQGSLGSLGSLASPASSRSCGGPTWARVAQWSGSRWVERLAGEGIVVLTQDDTGRPRVDVFSPGMSEETPAFRVTLDESSTVRQSTFIDVHLKHGQETFMLRFRASKEASGFVSRIQEAKSRGTSGSAGAALKKPDSFSSSLGSSCGSFFSSCAALSSASSEASGTTDYKRFSSAPSLPYRPAVLQRPKSLLGTPELLSSPHNGSAVSLSSKSHVKFPLQELLVLSNQNCDVFVKNSFRNTSGAPVVQNGAASSVSGRSRRKSLLPMKEKKQNENLTSNEEWVALGSVKLFVHAIPSQETVKKVTLYKSSFTGVKELASVLCESNLDLSGPEYSQVIDSNRSGFVRRYIGNFLEQAVSSSNTLLCDSIPRDCFRKYQLASRFGVRIDFKRNQRQFSTMDLQYEELVEELYGEDAPCGDDVIFSVFLQSRTEKEADSILSVLQC